MSFFDDSSLAFLPSGAAGKDGKAYSIKPTDGTGDFTFSRGSNLAATRVGPTGLIEKGRENLLLQSNNFDTTPWLLNTTSATSGQSGYDGTTDAWLLNSTGTGFPRVQQNVATSGVFVFSVYAKAATDGFMLIRTFGADAQVWFDLSDGSISNEAGAQYISSTIENIGNGWYRYSVLANGSLTSVRIYPASAYGVYSTSGNGIYIQDSQVEVGTLATEPIESGASTGKAGLLEDEPRFDYSGGATCPSLLLEPSRTNLVKYSEYFGGHPPSGSISFTYNDSISPEGITNAALVSASASGDRIQPLFAAINGLVCISIFLKHNGTNFSTQINTYNTGDTSLYGATASVTSSGVTFSSYQNGYDSADFVDYGNGWFRVYVVCQSTTGNTFAQWRPTTGSSVSYPCYGFQVEAGSYPTSYIPNHSGGTITRGAETSTGGNDIYEGVSEGAFFFEFQKTIQGESQTAINLTNDGVQQIRVHFDSSVQARFRDALNGFAKIGDSFDAFTSAVKVVLNINGSTAKLFLNGSQLGSDYTITTAHIFKDLIFSDKGFIVKQHLFFSTPLSDADCIALTS